jgi:hypothetical protein
VLHEIAKSRLESVRSREEFLSLVCGTVGDADHGLYVFLFANDSDEIIDDNHGKVAVHPRGLTLRPGKFQGGCRKRFSGYWRDVQRTGRDGRKESALLGCLRGLYVLTDLPKSAAALESEWSSDIDDFLTAYDLSAEPSRRSELRYLHRDSWTSTWTACFGSTFTDWPAVLAPTSPTPGRLSQTYRIA